jgi:hypothetical protein
MGIVCRCNRKREICHGRAVIGSIENGQYGFVGHINSPWAAQMNFRV